MTCVGWPPGGRSSGSIRSWRFTTPGTSRRACDCGTPASIGLALGGNARAGLADTLYLRKGEISSGNLPFVERSVQPACALDRPLASVEETEALLRLRKP
jgi:uncharacterized protein (DUF849 family)